MTLNPKSVGCKIKYLLIGEYFRFQYSDDDLEYVRKGCVLDLEQIPDGGFCNYYKESQIKVSHFCLEII